jgi:endonuclease/exonuclease/phosphatase family metal-dependent hydrolase
LIAARIALEADPLGLPDFDQQLPANLVAAFIPSGPLRILGIRVPYYETKDPRLAQSWEWLEAAGAELQNSASLIIGDLNVHVGSTLRGGDVFSRMLQNGWTRVQPTGSGSYFRKDGKWNEIDHVLISAKCKVNDAEYITDVGDIHFAGNSTALSDHAALVVDCEATST